MHIENNGLIVNRYIYIYMTNILGSIYIRTIILSYSYTYVQISSIDGD